MLDGMYNRVPIICVNARIIPIINPFFNRLPQFAGQVEANRPASHSSDMGELKVNIV